MEISISENKNLLGKAAAARGAGFIRRALADRGSAEIILASAASQFEMLAALVTEPGIDWSKVGIFHLDEYIGLAGDHPASFRRYMRDRVLSRLPAAPRIFHPVDPDNLEKLNADISSVTIDAAFVGIGENGHLAFNDPPADFETDQPYITIELDAVCRRQQLGEGWFPSLDAVPLRAVSMSIRRIMKSKAIICTVPDSRKAEAVKAAIDGPVSNLCPASILQEHDSAFIYLDRDSAALLEKR